MAPSRRYVRLLAAAAAALSAAAMVVAATSKIGDPDVWWVAAAGREMFAHRGVPRENVFSFSEPHHPWIMHEWLFGPLYAWGLARMGPVFFDAVALASTTAGLALVARGTVGRARHPAAGLAMLLAATAFFGARFLSARPTGVALLFPVAMTLVAFAPTFGRASIAAAGAIELVWTNAHGSFPLGLVLLGAALIDAPADADRKNRIVALRAALVATLATPYGPALYRFVWDYFRGDVGVYRAINAHIREFGSFPRAWGATVGPGDLTGLVLFVLLAAGAARRAPHRLRALLSLSLFALAFLHARHLELAGLVSCLLLTPYADALYGRRFAASAGPEAPAAGLARLVLVPGFVFGAIALAATARRSPAESVPSGAPLFRAMAAVPDGARLVAPFPQAGLVLWYGFSRGVRVLFDSRNDCYSAETFATQWALESRDTTIADRRAALVASRANAALVPAPSALATFLSAEPGWTVAHAEDGWEVFTAPALAREDGP
jgi:hypothetical protein